MWNRVERHLAALGSGDISSEFGDQRMSRLVARRREQEDDIPDHAKGNVSTMHR